MDSRYSKDNDMAVARYTLAVNRRYKRDGEQEADSSETPKTDKDGFMEAPKDENPFD